MDSGDEKHRIPGARDYPVTVQRATLDGGCSERRAALLERGDGTACQGSEELDGLRLFYAFGDLYYLDFHDLALR
jgi:hypothetical protein